MTQMELTLQPVQAKQALRKDPEIGEFCYLRPNKGEPDREEWSRYLQMFLIARLRAGEQPSDELAERARAYADMLHCQIYGMKLGEMMARREFPAMGATQ